MQTLYTAHVIYDDLGLANACEPTADADHAMDMVLECMKFGAHSARIFRTDFDENGDVETHRDVTEDLVRQRNEWLRAQGIEEVAA